MRRLLFALTGLVLVARGVRARRPAAPAPAKAAAVSATTFVVSGRG